MNKQQITGRTNQVKGSIKKAAGKAVGNEKLEREGKAQQVSGKVQTAIGDLKHDLKGATK
jgi:uncharacterized protein YjbJ (UPF0337 family)